MQPTPEFDQSYLPPPPPPPARHSRKGLWIGLGIGVGILCLCGIILVVGFTVLKPNIPILSNLFPSPTPEGLLYTNPSAGISLTYPVNWQYSEFGDPASSFGVMFASSPSLLGDSASQIATGAVLEVMTNTLKTSDIPFPVDPNAMGDVVDYIATSTSITQGQPTRTFTLSGFPAASGIYTMTDTSGAISAAYLTAALRNDEIIVFAGLCTQAEWTQYQPIFDSILNSVSLVTP